MTLSIPLMILQDQSAPYKGRWSLVQQGADKVEAIHATYHPDHPVGCVIECWSFNAQQPAQAFTRHLINHGWCITDLPESGAFFWTRLLGRL
jgi:hypothetical protein